MIRAAIVSLVMGAASVSLAAEEVSVGFAKADITPKVGGAAKAVWIAGYGMNRPAIGVHDPLFVRALVFKSGGQKVAMAVADLVGLQYPVILKIREKLSDFNYVLVSSTHVHEGPDVIGLWGEKPLKSGVDPEYIDMVVEKSVEAIKAADAAAIPVTATYGTAVDEEILRDSRKPYFKDGVIRAVLFKNAKDKKNVAILLQQNCHPEALTDKNQYLTTDFLYYTIKALEAKYGCPVAAFSGDVGGLMTIPNRIKSDDGKEVNDGNFEYAEIYGNKLAKRAAEAIDSAKPLNLAPIHAAAQICYVPIDNNVYKFAFRRKAMIRDAYVWNDDPWAESPKPFDPKDSIEKRAALKTEVAYVNLGDLHVAGIPGEAYPESIYGKFQEPVEPNADFPNAPLETPVVKALPGEKILVIGLANDEIGYIIPKRQWDFVAPFAYGMNKYQYGEVNSVGPEAAPVVYGSLEKAVKKATQK